MTTPLSVITSARQRYNAVNDDFWSDQELYDLIYGACMQLAHEGRVIERLFTTTTVLSQQVYAYPTQAIELKRVTVNGRKLSPYTMRDDDIETVINSATTATGNPDSYFVWEEELYLRPIPGTAGQTIEVFAYCEPQTISVTSTIETPTKYDAALINYLLAEMNAKNKNYQGAAFYTALWEKELVRARKDFARRKRGDAYALVKNVDIMPSNFLGMV